MAEDRYDFPTPSPGGEPSHDGAVHASEDLEGSFFDPTEEVAFQIATRGATRFGESIRSVHFIDNGRLMKALNTKEAHTKKGRVEELVAYAVEVFGEMTSFPSGADSATLIDRYYETALELHQSEPNDIEREMLVEQTEPVSGVTPISITARFMQLHPYHHEPQIADLIIRQHVLEMLSRQEEQPTIG